MVCPDKSQLQLEHRCSLAGLRACQVDNDCEVSLSVLKSQRVADCLAPLATTHLTHKAAAVPYELLSPILLQAVIWILSLINDVACEAVAH